MQSTVNGRRAQKLDALHAKFTKHLLRQLNYNAFKEPLGKICDDHQEEFECAHLQIQDYIQEQMNKHYERVKQEYNVVELFNALDQNVAAAKADPERTRQRIVPSPEQVARAQRVKAKTELLERLRNTEAELRAENHKLMNEIVVQDKELEQTTLNIATDIAQFNEATKIVNKLDVQQLEQTIRYLDSSM